MLLRTVTDQIVIADQPNETELAALKRDGFVGIVNLRHDGEPEQDLSTTAEGEIVGQLGMGYLHYGVGGMPLSEPGVKAVCAFINRHAETGKVLVHCRKGGRAAALVAIHQALLHGWKAEDVAANSERLGLKLEGNLRLIVESYLAGRPKA